MPLLSHFPSCASLRVRESLGSDLPRRGAAIQQQKPHDWQMWWLLTLYNSWSISRYSINFPNFISVQELWPLARPFSYFASAFRRDVSWCPSATWACHFCSQWAGRNHANEKWSVCPVPLPCCIFFAHFFFCILRQWDFLVRCEIFEAKLSDWQVCVRWWYRQPLAHCSWNVCTGPREVPYGHRYLRGLRERSGEDRCMVMVPGRAFFWAGKSLVNMMWTSENHGALS